jgi:hypothetical protein
MTFAVQFKEKLRWVCGVLVRGSESDSFGCSQFATRAVGPYDRLWGDKNVSMADTSIKERNACCLYIGTNRI